MRHIIFTTYLCLIFNFCFAIETNSKNTNWLKFDRQSEIPVDKMLSNKKLLNLTGKDELKLLSVKTDQLGFSHYKYQQYYCGILVENAIYIFHTKNNKVKKSNGKLVTSINVKGTSTPLINSTTALEKALEVIDAEEYAWENDAIEDAYKHVKKNQMVSFYPNGELVWFDIDNNGNYQLTYKFEIYALKPHSRKCIYIDANNGAVLQSVEKIHSCVSTNSKGLTNYVGEVDIAVCKNENSYTLKNSIDADIQVFDANNSSNISYNPIIDIDGYFDTDNAATEVYWATIKAKEYFLNTFNRNSIDNNGMPILSWVHYTNDSGYGGNAYWHGNWMLFGDGEDGRYSSFTSPDIVAHEMTHGITEYEANLSRLGESGALNESFSDIFGAAFKAYCQSENNWVIGSDIVIQPGKNGLRNLSNPKDETMINIQPNTYKGEKWANSDGKHINGGVQNYWFYLLAEGGQGVNDNGAPYNVEGIGLDKAIQIAYRNLDVYLSSKDEYIDARNGAIEAAIDLHGEDSFEAEQTALAWCAVGVGSGCRAAPNPSSCAYSDSLALVAIYNKIDADSWPNRWDVTKPMDEWTGVFLNENRCVNELALDGKGLTGSIAPEIGNLSEVEHIDLSENYLTGTIPASIGELENLKSLFLNYNSLEGNIPSSLTKLDELESLYLGNNLLSGTIPLFNANYSLKSLYLNNNQLEGVISSNLIGYNLTSLNLSNNDLSGIIPDFGFTNLTSINLSHNQLTGYIPTSYSQNSKLGRIELNDNLLEGTFPAEIGNLQDLGLIWLQNNLLEGCFHPYLKSLCEKSALVIDISDNNFDAEWEDFCDDNLGICTNTNSCRAQDSINLIVLNNSINNLGWNINEPIDTWAGVELNIDGCIKGLHLSDHTIGGTIPSEIGNFSELQVLSLAENDLTGEIPKEIGNLTNLRHLSLGKNYLTGKIPNEISDLKNLEYINLSYNSLTGLLPNEIGSLTNLQHVDLKENDLYGDISFIKNLTNLKDLTLSSNNLSGIIPTEINSFINLVGLRLNNNNLTGFLPDDFLKDANIDYLKISNNYLQGCYPASMYKLCGYGFPISEGNNFTIDFDGFCYNDFPCELAPGCRQKDSLTLLTVHESLKGLNGDDFWNLNQPIDTWPGVELNEQGCVKYIILFEQALGGRIPAAIGNLSNLEGLAIWDCMITGNIPPEIGNLHSLKELGLGWNDLQGEIPKEIGQLFNLKRLELNLNALTGPIPGTISSLKQLEYLRLNDNNLEGALPPLLSTLTNLQELDVTNNNLSGCYHPLLQSLCGQLGPLANVTEGNNFVEHWLDFCDDGVGKCAPAPCQMADSLSLVSFYLKTDGPNWSDWNQWDFTKPMNEWRGVTLNYDGCVERLNLAGVGLKNTITQDITNLVFLEELDLSFNELTGGVPSALANLSYLKTLNLRNNELSGYIPPQLPNLLTLQNLYLNNNQLVGGIPGQLVNLPNLDRLEVQNNQLNECYPGELILWCGAQNFQDWQISQGNNFPASWSAFCDDSEGVCGPANPCRAADSLSLLALNSSMPVFDWDTSQPIDTWPGVTLNESGCVKSIILDNAAFGTIPPEIGNFSELEVLTISNNKDVIGEIPGEIGNLPNLKKLIISNNGISGEIPSSLGLLGLNLKTLFLNDNNLTGPMPGFLTNFWNLSALSLKNNQLSGCYEDELSSFCYSATLGPYSSNVEISDGNNFDVSWEDFCNTGFGNCNLSCRAIDSISLLALNSSMPVFDWDTSQPIDTWPGVTLNQSGCVSSLILDNAAFGTIPPEIGDFSELEVLTISNNKDIIGSIPNSIGNLYNLKELDISNNGITGEIPSSLGLLDLEILFLNDNNLTGPMPWFLTNFQNLYALSLRNNQLSGCYDDELSFFCNSPQLGPFSSNYEISDGNNFDAKWEDFCNFGYGNCSTNFTTCRIIDSLSLLALNSSMPVFDWNTSQPIDTWPGITLNDSGCVTSIILDDAAFGIIPPEIGNFNSLEVLTISNNPNLLGDIPSEIGNLWNLKELDISNNGIGGEIPSSLGLLNLDVLFLNDNDLTGAMPGFLTNFENLYILSLRNNQLSGCYDEELSYFCAPSILGPFNSNYEISEGNNFDADWKDFCTSDLGTCLPPPSCRVTDSLSLLALHNSIEGLNWDLSSSIDNWFGVTLNEAGCVSKLLLGESLTGVLPPELGNFGSLNELVIVDSPITGSLPDEIGNLHNLAKLVIEDTEINSQFPPSMINLQKLEYLDYNNNPANSSFPSVLLGIESLKYLGLRGNDFNGTIPENISNLYNLERLHLNINKFSGNLPSALANLSNLYELHVSYNNLSGCFDESLLSLCYQIDPISFNSINEGNLFDANWGDFCQQGVDACITNEVWPGDFDSNGIVDKDDLLYYGLAEGNTGPLRENASTAWFGQQATNWQSSVNGINSKHHDADGNGIVNQNDIQPIIDNYNYGTNYQLDGLVSNPVRLELEPAGNTEGFNEIIKSFDLYAVSTLNTPVSLHGISGSINLSRFPIKRVEVDFENSALSESEHIYYFDERRGILDIAISRIDRTNQVVNGSLAKVHVIIENIPSGGSYEVNINGGSTMSANGILNSIGGSTIFGYIPLNGGLQGGLDGLLGELAISVIAGNEQCNSLGNATVRALNGTAPFSYSWSTGEITGRINNLYSDDYSVTVTDANNLSATIQFQIKGVPQVYDDNGELICEKDCPDYLTTHPYINAGLHKAAKTLNTNGRINENVEVELKAGESILLEQGFEIQQGAELSIDIEDCE